MYPASLSGKNGQMHACKKAATRYGCRLANANVARSALFNSGHQIEHCFFCTAEEHERIIGSEKWIGYTGKTGTQRALDHYDRARLVDIENGHADSAMDSSNIGCPRSRYNAHEQARLEHTKKRSATPLQWVGTAFSTRAKTRLVGHPFVVIFLELTFNFTLTFGKRFVEVASRSGGR